MTTDPRLTDTRIETARKPVWENDWDDNNTLRAGWVERLAPYDPNPQYSALDLMDGLDETTNPPFPPVRADSLPVHDIPPLHGYYRLYEIAVWVAAISLPLLLVVAIVAGGAE